MDPVKLRYEPRHVTVTATRVTNGTRGLVRFSPLTCVAFVVPARHVCFGHHVVLTCASYMPERRKSREEHRVQTMVGGSPVIWFFESAALDETIDISQHTWTWRREKKRLSDGLGWMFYEGAKRHANEERPATISTLVNYKTTCVRNLH